MNINRFSLIAVSSMSVVSAFAGTTEEKQPNILFCIADDAGHMSAYGTNWVNTPNFDYVADNGILFNNFYTCNSKSGPSRAAIITGRNSWQLEEACNHWTNFPLKFKSFVEVLTENGYNTGFTGKGWGPGYAKNANGKNRLLTGRKWNNIKTTPPTTEISSIDYFENFKLFMKKRNKEKPFFFWYGCLEPHRKYEYCSSERYGKKIEDIDSVPQYWPDNAVVRRDMLDYAVEVEYFDRHLGDMLKYLDEIGELDNTIVIVTSDHNMPFPRCKGQAYYHSNHIPMAIMWKDGLVKPGRIENDFYSVIDIAPTVLDLAGLKEKDTKMEPITGYSMVDLIKNRKNKIDRSFVLIGKERHDVGRPDDVGYPMRAIINNEYLYIRNYETGRWPSGNPETGYMDVDSSPTKTEVLKCRKDPSTNYIWQLCMGKRVDEELYNIKEDPECINNLAFDSQYSEVLNKMKEKLENNLIKQNDPRMFGKGDMFEKYPFRYKLLYNFYNRMKKGEDVKQNVYSVTDFEYIVE